MLATHRRASSSSSRSLGNQTFSSTFPLLPLRIETRTNWLPLTRPIVKQIPHLPFLNLRTCNTHPSSSTIFTLKLYAAGNRRMDVKE
ncbi:hypothetical protein L873DRAFT_190761 [Choiromyces venosus 120613-1]|uniref:Uncharacterized protein n=1 Tax=Choiromyces venosus 120613-1 TaxID=1336337 RepID=A0A3N4J2W4_9PEZI|nr:hypothetical protein L873DRAFT_190761 [Choiromyces venosus 120613-1]